MTDMEVDYPLMAETHLTYERIELGSTMVTTDFLLERIKESRVHDVSMKAVVSTFRMAILGRTLHSVRYPATWWDAVLGRWAPRRAWLPDWLTPHYTTVTTKALYPGLDPDREIGWSEVRVG